MTTFPRVGCLGLNYRAAPVEIREHLSFAPAAAGRVRTRAKREDRLDGFALLSTCNRIEFYVHLSQVPNADTAAVVEDLISEVPGVDLPAVRPYFYAHEGQAAVRHLCRVAAGLDSMVLGEPQILGQVGAAYKDAEESGTASGALAASFQAALKVGKRARLETAVNRNPVSIASVAIDLARRIAGPLTDLRATVIGAGEMGGLVVKILRTFDVGRVTILNRNVTRALSLAERMGCEAAPLTHLARQLADTDLVICATKSEEVLVRQQDVEGRRLVLIDLSVPRNIDPKVGALGGDVQLFDIDDLRAGVEASLSKRRQEIPRVERLIDEEVRQLRLRLREEAVEPVIAGLRRKAESIRLQELERAIESMDELSPKAIEQLRYFSRTLVNRLLHEPTRRLRKAAAGGESGQVASVVRSLFALKDSDRS